MLAKVKSLLKSLPILKPLVRERDELEFELRCLKRHLATFEPGAACYDHDGMRIFHKNMDFMNSMKFQTAYQAGMNSGHKINRLPGSADDIHIEWRVHMACWAASHACHLPGDFVECGVNTGIMSLAICNFVDFNSHDKSFYLFDTFCGIPEEQMAPDEKPARTIENGSMYEECFALVQRNFQKFGRAVLVRGMVPETLHQVEIEKVSYLSIDMNIAAPEIAAIEHFWDRLVPGAIVLLDDYGWIHHTLQKEAMDEFAGRKGVMIATLPTGQGLIIKP